MSEDEKNTTVSNKGWTSSAPSSSEAALQKRLAQQELMFALSQNFISTASMSVLVPNALRMVGEFMDISKLVLMQRNHETQTLDAAEYIWYNETQDFYRPKSISMPLLPGTPTYDHFIAGKTPYVVCSDVANSEECSYAAGHGIKSLLDVPVHVDGEYWGSLSFNECTCIREWSPSDIQLARHIGSVISGAISRNRMEEKLIWAMERAEESSKAKGEFLSRMSHEIRTPLNAVIGMTHIARSTKVAEKKEYCLEKIEEASVHLLGVINDILDMSKIEAKKFELSYSDFDFSEMLMRVLGVITYRSDEKGQNLIVNLDDTLRHSIVSDEQRLAQVIANLLSNAVKFTPEGGTITLGVRKTGEKNGLCTLEIEVEDTGIGMTPEQLGRLFQSFEQADRDIAGKFGGTGLGLAISRSIVELMGGTIRAESTPGVGSRFTCTVKARHGERMFQAMAAPAADWQTLRALVVDDSPDVRAYFQNYADAKRLSCEVASSGEEALRLVGERGLDYFNLIFIDWRMPGMDGVELTRRLKAQLPEHVAVIMISAYQWNEIGDEAQRAGVDRFLPKPLFHSQITDCINECLGATHAVQEAKELEESPRKGCFAGRRILLVEDIEVNREIVISLLEHTGIVIECAENGRVAYESFKRAPSRYELIFMDVHMPEMDGYEATRLIRASGLPGAQDIPIVAMTADVFRQDIDRCLEAGMNDHISKPIDVEEICAKVERALTARNPQPLPSQI